MIHYKDFVPQVVEEGGFFSEATYESLNQAVARMNDWVEQDSINVVNIETVALPNIHESGEQGSADVKIYVSGDNYSNWHQFIRVWYRD